jgi:sec-independent protein translocase protein TatC
MDKDEKKDELKSMSLGDHLEELRARLILIILGVFVGLIVSLFFGRFLVDILTIPFARALGSPDVMHELQTIQPAEGFLVYIKVCLFFGLLITSPWVFWHLWAFISSGLYKHEKKYVHVVVPLSAALFITGSVFFMVVIAPLAFGFFVKFNERLSLASNWTFQNYINMVLMLTLVFGIAFQLPIAIVFAERMGLVSIEQLSKGRKFVLLGLVIIAAMATPPDVISQIALAVPLYGLFECSILFCRFTRRRKK